MNGRVRGLIIAVVGTLGATPDAVLLRFMAASGAVTPVITVWRFIIVGILNLVMAIGMQGGVRPLLNGIISAPVPLCIAVVLIAITNIGFVLSLLKVDPAKALLLISLNPLWAAALGYVCLGDRLPPRTVIAQALSLFSILLVFVPNLIALFEGDAQTSSGASEMLDLLPLVTGLAMAGFLTYTRYCSQNGVSDASMEVAPPFASAATALVALEMAREQGVTSLVGGLTPGFWLALAANGVGICLYNGALVVAPRYIPGGEVALVLLGEAIVGPMWVFFVFGTVPSSWTVCGGALLMITLVWHEVMGIREIGHGSAHTAGDRDSNASSFDLDLASPVTSPKLLAAPIRFSGSPRVPRRVSSPPDAHYEFHGPHMSGAMRTCSDSSVYHLRTGQ